MQCKNDTAKKIKKDSINAKKLKIENFNLLHAFTQSTTFVQTSVSSLHEIFDIHNKDKFWNRP